MWIIYSRNLVYLDLYLRETCYNFISSRLKLLHVAFLLIFLLVKPVLFVELVACWLLSMKLNLSRCFSSWNLLYVGLFLRETRCVLIFAHETCVCGFILRETLCIVIYVFEKLVIFLFLLHETCCMLIFLFEKIVHWFFSSWKRLCSLKMLRAGFCSWQWIYLVFFLHETCCFLIYSILTLNLS